MKSQMEKKETVSLKGDEDGFVDLLSVIMMMLAPLVLLVNTINWANKILACGNTFGDYSCTGCVGDPACDHCEHWCNEHDVSALNCWSDGCKSMALAKVKIAGATTTAFRVSFKQKVMIAFHENNCHQSFGKAVRDLIWDDVFTGETVGPRGRLHWELKPLEDVFPVLGREERAKIECATIGCSNDRYRPKQICLCCHESGAVSIVSIVMLFMLPLIMLVNTFRLFNRVGQSIMFEEGEALTLERMSDSMTGDGCFTLNRMPHHMVEQHAAMIRQARDRVNRLEVELSYAEEEDTEVVCAVLKSARVSFIILKKYVKEEERLWNQESYIWSACVDEEASRKNTLYGEYDEEAMVDMKTVVYGNAPHGNTVASSLVETLEEKQERDDYYDTLVKYRAMPNVNAIEMGEDYEEWTVAMLDKDMKLIGDAEEFEDEETAREIYVNTICEAALDGGGAILSHHTNWKMIDGMFTSETWTDLEIHEAGTPCDCASCCEHPSCTISGICVEHCEEHDGPCPVDSLEDDDSGATDIRGVILGGAALFLIVEGLLHTTEVISALWNGDSLLTTVLVSIHAGVFFVGAYFIGHDHTHHGEPEEHEFHVLIPIEDEKRFTIHEIMDEWENCYGEDMLDEYKGFCDNMYAIAAEFHNRDVHQRFPNVFCEKCDGKICPDTGGCKCQPTWSRLIDDDEISTAQLKTIRDEDDRFATVHEWDDSGAVSIYGIVMLFLMPLVFIVNMAKKGVSAKDLVIPRATADQIEALSEEDKQGLQFHKTHCFVWCYLCNNSRLLNVGRNYRGGARREKSFRATCQTDNCSNLKHFKQKMPPEWSPKSLETVKQMGTRPEQWGIAPVRWFVKRIESWRSCQATIQTGTLNQGYGHRNHKPWKAVVRQFVVENREKRMPMKWLRKWRTNEITTNILSCHGSGGVVRIITPHDAVMHQEDMVSSEVKEQEYGQSYADRSQNRAIRKAHFESQDSIAKVYAHFTNRSSTLRADLIYSEQDDTQILVIEEECQVCKDGEVDDRNVDPTVKAGHYPYVALGQTLTPNKRRMGFKAGPETRGRWVKNKTRCGEVAWPDNTDGTVARLDSRFSHHDCMVCGKPYIKSGLVPVIAEDDDGVWHRMWVGQDCAKKFLGFMEFNIRADECKKCDASGTIVSETKPSWREREEGDVPITEFDCVECMKVGSHEEMVIEYDMTIETGGKHDVITVIKAKDVGESIRWVQDDGTLDLLPYERD